VREYSRYHLLGIAGWAAFVSALTHFIPWTGTWAMVFTVMMVGNDIIEEVRKERKD
jgi:hypothetical protein